MHGGMALYALWPYAKDPFLTRGQSVPLEI